MSVKRSHTEANRCVVQLNGLLFILSKTILVQIEIISKLMTHTLVYDEKLYFG